MWVNVVLTCVGAWVFAALVMGSAIGRAVRIAESHRESRPHVGHRGQLVPFPLARRID